MVIGNGMIAQRFSKYADDEKYLIFASGVSNSSSQHEADHTRERNLLSTVLQEQKDKTLIYFSTCSIYDPSLQQSRYVLHKKEMEILIQAQSDSYFIFRVSNPVGITQNVHTVLNFFITHIKTGQSFTVWQYASRNLIDLDDVFLLCDCIIQSQLYSNTILNIANPVNYPVLSIIEAVENHFTKKGNYSIAEKGNSPLIDTSAIHLLFGRLHINFKQGYLPGLLQKYYPTT